MFRNAPPNLQKKPMRIIGDNPEQDKAVNKKLKVESPAMKPMEFVKSLDKFAYDKKVNQTA